MPRGTARRDDRLRAIVVGRTPLHYADGADPTRDRPAHVRAASAIVPWRGGFAVVQDDAGFVGWIAQDGRITALELPPGPDGERQFDDTRGNKHHKLDLEAAFVLPTPGGDVVVALGSGSTAVRRRIVVVPVDGGRGPARIFDGAPLYAALSAALPGELNIEGAFRRGGRQVRLLQRGNGIGAIDATADVDVAWFERLLADAPHADPALDVRAWDLGRIEGAALTFTDGLDAADGWWFLAAAEDSPDAVRDGPVTGSVVGRADDDRGRWAPLVSPDGAVLPVKAEGLCPSERAGEMLVVVDADDPALPAELLRVVLDGPWT